MPRCLARGLADGWPTTLPSGVDRSVTSLDSEQQRIRPLPAVDDADLEVAANVACRLGDHGRDLRSTAGAMDHGKQLPTAGKESSNHIHADHGQILADDHDITVNHPHDVAGVTPSGAGR